MIPEIRLSNFFSIKDEVVLDCAGKNGKTDPLKTEESDHLKFLLQKM